jgi:hypothetical protein
MKNVLKTTLILIAYVFLTYHFVGKVIVPTFFPEEQHIVNDFGPYYVASRLVAQGSIPYRSIDNHHNMELTSDELASWEMNKRVIPAYIYPPFLAVALIPLSKFAFPEARFLWSIFSSICFLLCIFLTFHLLKLGPKLDITTLLIFSVFLASMPTLESFTLGQVNYAVLLLILSSFVFHKQKRATLGGGH